MPGSVSAPVRATPTSAASDASRARSPIASSARICSVMSRTRDTANRRPPSQNAWLLHLDGENRPILAAVSGPERDRLSGVEFATDLFERGGSDIRIEVERMHSDQFVLRVPQALTRLSVHVQDAARVVVEEEGIRCVVHEHAEPLLAGPQRVLGPLPLGDVSGHMHRP